MILSLYKDIGCHARHPFNSFHRSPKQTQVLRVISLVISSGLFDLPTGGLCGHRFVNMHKAYLIIQIMQEMGIFGRYLVYSSKR